MSEFDELFRNLAASDPKVAAASAEALLGSSCPLTGVPPPELLQAMTVGAGLPDDSLLNLARAWSRAEMSRAALDALHRSATAQDKERFAWLLKTVLAVEDAPEAIVCVLDSAEDARVRRWVLEGLERLAFGGFLGWEQLDSVVAALALERTPALRLGLASVLMALAWRPDNVHLLEPLLSDSHAEVVTAAARTLQGHPDAVRRLNPDVLDRLRIHTNPWIRHSAQELDEALRQS
ncbi:MAG TPA: hypothetical protein VIX89_12530 [Bryobacteraceae bacterium]